MDIYCTVLYCIIDIQYNIITDGHHITSVQFRRTEIWGEEDELMRPDFSR